jgi:hypothetical protein
VAAGYTLTLHAALWLPITLLGAYYMARMGLKWDRVQREYETMQSNEGPVKTDDGQPTPDDGVSVTR